VKQLSPVSSDSEIQDIIEDRFNKEAGILGALGEDHDQIPKLYAHFSEANEYYLVQEWIEGKNLTQLIRTEGSLSETMVKEMLISLLSVLEYVHSRGKIHRDITPANIIVRDKDKKPVLIDFGAVKEVMIDPDPDITFVPSIAIGNPNFMPEEQARGRPVFASDLYSLGWTAIFLLTGKKKDEIDRNLYLLNIHSDLTAILYKATETLAENRYQTAREMLKALNCFPGGKGHRVLLSTLPSIAISGPNQDVSHSRFEIRLPSSDFEPTRPQEEAPSRQEARDSKSVLEIPVASAAETRGPEKPRSKLARLESQLPRSVLKVKPRADANKLESQRNERHSSNLAYAVTGVLILVILLAAGVAGALLDSRSKWMALAEQKKQEAAEAKTRAEREAADRERVEKTKKQTQDELQEEKRKREAADTRINDLEEVASKDLTGKIQNVGRIVMFSRTTSKGCAYTSNSMHIIFAMQSVSRRLTLNMHQEES